MKNKIVKGIVNNFKCLSIIFFLLFPSARLQFLFFLPPLFRPFMALLLKDVYESLSLRHYKTVHGSPFHCIYVPLSFSVLFCLIVIAASVLNILSSLLALQVSFCFQRGSNSFLAMNRIFLLFCHAGRVAIQGRIIK